MKSDSRNDYISFCHVCPSHCSRKISVEEGKIVSVDRDLESGLPTEWCTFTRGRIIPEVCGHPDRLKYPLRREGARGEGKWRRISWEEALETMAQKLAGYKRDFGPNSVSICLGEPKGLEFAFAQRLASAFGTSNVATPGNY
jgi:anaerobic selenocysteine-containing dehydrogenase